MYRFIENIGDFFTPGYYTEDFISKVISLSGYDGDAIKEFNKRFSGLKTQYFETKGHIKSQKLHKKYIIQETHDFNTKIMAALGYDTTPAYANWIYVDESSVIPARSVLYNGAQARLVVLEMQAMIKSNEDDVPAGLFEQQYDDTTEKTVKEQKYIYSQWATVINKDLPEGCKISPSKINDCVTAIFRLPKEQRPQYIVIFAGNVIFLMEQDKWDHGAYVKFDLEELFSEAAITANKNYYSLFYLLASKEVLAGDAQIVLMDKIAEESFKNAYEVTKDLKEGVINAVELLANEAIYYKRTVLGEEFDETDESFASQVKDDCLSIIYRLLFVFYAEARPEIGILPMKDDAYAKGYSLEILRDLEQTPLKSDYSQNSYFFHDSLWQLFSLIGEGYNDTTAVIHKSFTVKKIDSPLFNDDKLKQLKGVKYRNKIWQQIICDLSLSKEQNRKNRGRISYANLGVNQLGSVYESLLAYRGFYAEEDYIEVHTAGKPEDGTFLVPRSRMGDFNNNEILRDSNDEVVILPRGKFVYRLNGRDRKKSASYYTPEVLTKSTVKYTLLGFKEKLDNGEMKAEDLLSLKILEPAMGAAAFQNEVINQLAEMYLTYRQKEVGKHISPAEYQDERQKVKAYIATKNIYGVDLNPTAIELGKLALWLNVMHKDMETPFFAHRIALGNAVIGAWFKAYDVSDLYKKSGLRTIGISWWEKAPHLLHFNRATKKIIRKNSEIYHFLIPDKNMLAALQIKEEKAQHPEIARSMQNRIKDWTKPLSAEDILILKKISHKIDKVISEYIEYQEKIEKLTANNYKVWEHRSYVNNALFSFLDKESLLNTRNAKTNAYHKLVTIMNYWCALWFWEYEDAESLPSREDYWNDIEKILDIDFSTRQYKETSSYAPSNDYMLFGFGDNEDEPEIDTSAEEVTEEEPTTASEQVTYTKEDAAKILESCSNSGGLFEDARTPIVEKLANKYHFFHPMLEFIEVFWLRDGFDVICGNPPWIKLQFDDKAVLSERFPEVAIRKISAPAARAMKDTILQVQYMKNVYRSEEIETECQAAFLNAYSNYPLLVGQQTNLYKCVLTNCFDLSSDTGYIGILCPESIYDDPKGHVLRQEMYRRLRYHFQYQNELRLFAEVHHHTVYGDQLLGPRSSSPNFLSIHNLFHPNTVDACFAHDGHGKCGGIKDEEGNWNTSAHANRIVRFTEEELRVLAKTFEDSDEWEGTKLVGIHNRDIVEVLRSLSAFSTHVSDFETIISEGLHETGAVDKGWMKRDVRFPDWDKQEMIYSGPHFNVGNPLVKTPRETCILNSDYDCIDLESISDDYTARTNYVPIIPLTEFRNLIKGFVVGQNSNGEELYDCWMDYYKVTFRLMTGGGAGERTLTSAILPPHSSHIVTAISTIFRDKRLCVEFAGLSASVVLDFFIKTIGCGAIHASRVDSFPLGIADLYKSSLFARTLRLNCVTNRYAELWAEVWDESYKSEQWSIEDLRLASWNALTRKWNHDTPLRNYFERRQALVEIDVIAAMALGLTLDELNMMYEIQFPVLQQNENDTWYDANGRIIFTCSKGLVGVGLDRPVWNQICGELSEDGLTYSGVAPTYESIIDPAKSELYGGQKVTYYAPYTKCDRIADYRRAWAHFEKVFNEEKKN